MWTENEEGLKVQLFTAYSEQDEAYWVCQQIRELMAFGGYNLRDFAVLMRMNALSRSFEQEFQQAHLTYKIFGGFKFFERKEIRDILSYMRLIVNRCDSEAFMRAINVPKKRGIGDTTLTKLRGLSADFGISLPEVISDERNLEIFNKPTRQKLLDFYALYADLCDLAQKLSVGQFVHTMLERLQFREVYAEIGDDDRALNVDEFEESVNEFQKANPAANLSEYLQSVSLATDGDEADDGNYITIATIHAVKGLEFKTVFVIGLEEGIFPTSRASYELESMQEERRLMYVAATRAEKRLYLTHAQSRFMWGERQKKFPSKYFTEVQKYLQPPRTAATEKQLSDDKFLDKLINKEPTRTAPNQGKTSSELKQFKVGQLVEHSAFGQGMILRISGDVADIIFEKTGKKSLNLKFAPLKIIK